VEFTALWIFEDELKYLHEINFVSARFSFSPPVHKYQGILYFEESLIKLEGTNNDGLTIIEINIYKSQIDEIFLGFDQIYTIYVSRGLGFWKPIRIKYINNKLISTLYLIVNYRIGFTDNNKFFNLLKDWLI
jgi:hypothetical protein